jgi:glutamate--cysteine ligase
MPAPTPHLSSAEVAARLARDIEPDGPDGRVGIELEWLTRRAGGDRRPTLAETEAVASAVGELPRGGRVTIEPGGQLELSTLPHADVHRACEAAATDLFVLDQTCRERGLDLIALGADPVRDPERVVTAPRYRAMQAHFDRRWPDGVEMMCNTASIQLNVGLGADSDEAQERWHLANALGPVLLACFANSPFANGRPSGWQSTRLRSWWRLDPSRTAPVDLDRDPVDAWLRYAMDANVMLIRVDDHRYVPVDHPFTFREWLASGHELGFPTEDDLEYHLTTLFPPVRPRGWFELRMFDALPTPFWHVAVAVTTALLDDPVARREVTAAAVDTGSLWVDAAQLGLAHPELARAAPVVFEAALDALIRSGADEAIVNVTRTYFDRWVARGRCPADDRLDAWRRDGSLFPRAESPVPYADFAETWA